MSLPEIPDDVFAGDTALDFAGLYLSASEDRIHGKSFDGEGFEAVQAIARRAQVLTYPPMTGTRVSFSTELEAVLAYANPPEPGSTGVVVTVRSASGDVNHHDGMIFVRWDNGTMTQVYADHLKLASGRPRRADAVRMRVASLGDLTDFLKVAADTLVHRATKDLWSFRQDGGEFIIERLFDASGEPLTV
jgi:hypothetical protein